MTRAPHRRRRGASVVVVLLLAFLAPACSEDGSDGAAGPAGDAPPQTGDEISVADYAAVVDAAYAGATTARLSMTSAAPGPDMAARGVVDLSTEPVSLRLALDSPLYGRGGMRLRVVEGVQYATDPGRPGRPSPRDGPGERGRWTATDLDGSDAHGSTLATTAFPGLSGDLLVQDVERVVHLGERELRGEMMQHYYAEGSVDGTDHRTWFDAAGRLRQVVVEGPRPGVSRQVRLDDWGAPVRIVAPPAGRVSAEE